jgi:DHA1 family tetracycline resistance protein-like MFS transporter
LRSSPLLPIFLIVLVDILGLTMLMPMLPFYAKTLGATETQVGFLLAIYALCQLVAGPPLGKLSDRFGRKPVLLVSQLGTFIGFLILASATTLWVAFLSRMIDGLTAGNLTVAQAYISDVTKPKDRAKSFAVIGIAFGVGFLIGPAATAQIASHFGDHYAIFAAAGLSALSICATLVLLPAHPVRPALEPGEDPGPAAPGGERLGLTDWGTYAIYFKRPGLAKVLWQFFCFAVAFALYTGGFALFAAQRLGYGTTQVAYLMAYAGFLGVILQGGLIGRLVKTFGEAKLLIAGFGFMAVSCVVYGFGYSIAMMMVATTLMAGSGMIRPVVSSLISQRAGRHEQGVVIGLTQSLASVAQIIGPILAGVLIQNHLLYTWAFLAAGVAALGVLLETAKT